MNKNDTQQSIWINFSACVNVCVCVSHTFADASF